MKIEIEVDEQTYTMLREASAWISVTPVNSSRHAQVQATTHEQKIREFLTDLAIKVRFALS